MKKRVVMFCGGSGGTELIKDLTRREDIALTVLVNCYDDGLSTGQLRNFIPGMLGPSDIRKTVKHSLLPDGLFYNEFDFLLGNRFPAQSKNISLFRQLFGLITNNGVLGHLNIERQNSFLRAISRFLKYSKMQPTEFIWDDVSLGNIFFAGLFLECWDFNTTIQKFTEFFNIKNSIYNLTDGTDLKLVGITEDACYLPDEASISSLPMQQKIKDIFLLDKKQLSIDTKNGEFVTLSETGKEAYLKKCSRIPKINPNAYNAILAADLILYWAGTQHSSLFPSYLTKGVAEAVGKSKAVKKVLAMNILKDKDIYRETAFSLLKKAFYYLSGKGKELGALGSLITDVLMNNAGDECNESFLPLGMPYGSLSGTSITIGNWSNPAGKHNIPKLLQWLG